MLTICYAKLVVVYTFYAFVNILDTLKINRQNYLIFYLCPCFCTELRFGERYIKVNSLVALTPFLSERLDSDTRTNNLYAISEVIRNRDCNLWNTITDTPSHPLYKLITP